METKTGAPMAANEALERVGDAADLAMTTATRLQQKTEDMPRDEAADRAKEVAHEARIAADTLQASLNQAGGAAVAHSASKQASSAEAEAAKIAEAAAEVEKELIDVAAELAAATPGQAHDSEPTPQTLASYKTTEQAVKELELLAQKRASKHVQIKTIFAAAWAAWALFLLLIIQVFHLGGRELWVSGIVGVVWGLLAAAIYHKHRQWKAERTDRLAMIPGAKGIQYLCHHIPSWISFSDTEKVEWLNRFLAKAWPYYDAAICEEVKHQVEPLMDLYKPPFIKSIYFKKLTFGDAPFRIEGIRVEDRNSEAIQIETDFRWSGDMSIHLAIETLAGGSATRMVPKVSDVAVSGTARVILMPLLPEIPGFGAATVSLMKPPVVKFHLDFGAAFGGSYSAKMIQAWLDPFLRSTVAGMMVWPKRMVVPILGEMVTGPLDDLYQRHKGALQVDVISAQGLPRMDRIGTADPYVELYTQANIVEETSVKKNTLTPVWNERIWVLVQEPDTQLAYITVNDVDFANIRELFRVNVLKGATQVFQSKELIGRAILRIADFQDDPGQARDVTVPLGLDEFADEDGCGGGRGELKLQVTYWPLEKMGGHAEALYGAFIVTLIRCDELAAADIETRSSDPFVKFTCNKVTKQSEVQYRQLNPRWTAARFDFYKVPSREHLTVEVYDYDRVFANDFLGRVTIDVHKEVACAPKGDVTKSWNLQDVPGEFMGEANKPSTITLRLQWIPFAGIHV